MTSSLQDEVHKKSIESPESFWAEHANQLHWERKPDKVYQTSTKELPDGTKHQTWEWFPGGQISTTYNCVDRHVVAGNGDKTAIVWDSPVTGAKQKITYQELLEEVETLAGVMREEGVRKGDVVLVYSKDKCSHIRREIAYAIQCL